MLELNLQNLHAALQDPILNIPVFHTEIMNRYPKAISFAPGAPNLDFAKDFTPADYIARFVKHLRDDRGLTAQQASNLLYEYGPSRGIINELVAEALRRDLGVDVAARSVVITVGAQEAMLLVLRALRRDAEDLIAVVNPCFIGFSGAARLLDVELVPVEETADGPDLDQLACACRQARAAGRRIRALYVAPDYSNPAGTLMDRGARERLLDLAAQEDLLLIEDNTYGFTVAPGAEVPAIKALDRDRRVILIGTFAKICLPGARVGLVVADQPVGPQGGGRVLADELAKLKGVITLNTPAVSQAVIGGMLLEHGGSIARTGAEKSALYRRNLNVMLDALDRHLGDGEGLPGGISWNRPSGGFFIRMRLPVRADAKLLESCAARYQVLWTPMSQFFLDGKGTNEIRLSCSYLDTEQIEEGVRRLAAFLRGLGA
jgi:(S)-3,5-dihydroxyphenylglycine transaminase